MTDQKTPLHARLGLAARDPNSGRLAGPGHLRTTDLGVEAGGPDGLSLADYAVEHGLRPSAQRPAIPAYLRQLWRRAHFIAAFATARNIAMYTEAKLGQLWQVLTPLLNAGRLLPDLRIAAGYQPRHPQLPWLRRHRRVRLQLHPAGIHLHLDGDDRQPRADQGAALPKGGAAAGLRDDRIPADAAVDRRPGPDPAHSPTSRLTWTWLLAIPALLLQTIFNVGVGLAGRAARLAGQRLQPAAAVPDAHLALRLRRAVQHPDRRPRRNAKIVALLEINPAALYITLTATR